MDRDGKIIVEFIKKGKYNYIDRFEKSDIFLLCIDGKYGAINSQGDVIAECIYDSISISNRTKVLALELGNETLLINETGKTLKLPYPVRPVYSNVFSVSGGYVVYDDLFNIVAKYKCGYGSINGHILEFNVVYDEFAIIYTENEVYGVIGKDGLIIDFKYGNIKYVNGLFLAIARNKKSCHVFDRQGKEIAHCDFTKYDSSEKDKNRGVRSIHKSCSCVDIVHGVFVVGFDKKEYEYSELCSKDTKFALLDKNCNFITKAIYDRVKLLDNYDDYIEVGIEYSSGLFDKDGSLLYECAYSFYTIGNKDSDTFYLAMINCSVCKIVDKNFNIVFEYKSNVELCARCWGGLMFCFLAGGEKLVCVDLKHNRIFEFECNSYDSDYESINERFLINKTGCSKILNRDGSVILETKYDCITDMSNDFYKVRKDNEWGVIDIHGNKYDWVKIEDIYSYENNEKVGFEILTNERNVDFLERLYYKCDCFKKYKNYISIKRREKWGVADLSGECIVEPTFKEEIKFLNKLSKDIVEIEFNGSAIIVDSKGDIKYDGFKKYENYISVRLGDKWGIADLTGKELVKPVFYEEIKFIKRISDEYIKIELDGNNVMVNGSGGVV
ncbi:WG repeat-containing protein [Campylobacter gastrosuis]|uniref:WG repeat-containing protein n=1 Tax=Campylobacter gastrosuis TaxID=2974576 RepID=A0ABT7HSG8_9BACT|nr:WG repeat-containing protein [Campylobacter gastrosuis]MDL0089871.1 WG repeat-containing protein [Campylobacter gastrosuis]